MNKLLVLSAAVAASGFAMAQDIGRVLSSTPFVQQVAVPRQVCSIEQVAIQQPRTGAGAAIGAIAGGVVGSAAGGRGAGQAAAAMIGAIGGAVIGNEMESAPPEQLHNVQRCSVQTSYETRTVGYNVVYEFAGKQYAAQMPYDPGPTIQLQVSPAGAGTQMAQPTSPIVTQQPVYVQSPPVVVAPPVVYPGYYAAPYPYYSPIGISLGFGYWGGGHHYRR